MLGREGTQGNLQENLCLARYSKIISRSLVQVLRNNFVMRSKNDFFDAGRLIFGGGSCIVLSTLVDCRQQTSLDGCSESLSRYVCIYTQNYPLNIHVGQDVKAMFLVWTSSGLE